MANPAHVSLLYEGPDPWNQWRNANPDVQPDLSGTSITDLRLPGVDLSRANLSRSDVAFSRLSHSLFVESNLFDTNFMHADLEGCNFTNARMVQTVLNRAELADACLDHADLSHARLFNARMRRATLVEAKLDHADLSTAWLTEADLSGTTLSWATIRRTELTGSNLSNSTMAQTILANVDLTNVIGLETVVHAGPSHIDWQSLLRNGSHVPKGFLRGLGVAELLLDYLPSLAQAPLLYQPCFISYSNQDLEFARHLHRDLQAEGVRCWFAPADLPIGAKTRPSLDEQILLHDRLLLILSEDSIASPWVEQEVETALAKERKENRLVLFPIRLDDAVMRVETGWPALVRNSRNIGDFRDWTKPKNYQSALERLLRDLQAVNHTTHAG